MRGLYVMLTLQPKFLNRVRSYVDLPVGFEELSRMQ